MKLDLTLVIGDQTVKTVRYNNWKLILHDGATGFSKHAGYKTPPGSPKGQLYDMENDRGEEHSLYEKHPEIVKQLTDFIQTDSIRGRSIIE